MREEMKLCVSCVILFSLISENTASKDGRCPSHKEVRTAALISSKIPCYTDKDCWNQDEKCCRARFGYACIQAIEDEHSKREKSNKKDDCSDDHHKDGDHHEKCHKHHTLYSVVAIVSFLTILLFLLISLFVMKKFCVNRKIRNSMVIVRSENSSNNKNDNVAKCSADVTKEELQAIDRMEQNWMAGSQPPPYIFTTATAPPAYTHDPPPRYSIGFNVKSSEKYEKY